MLDALSRPQASFARAGKKARRAPQAPAVPEAKPERVPPLAKLLLACAAVVAAYAWVRLAAPLPWSYDEYYHLGLAREMLSSGLRITSFRWTPFSITYDHFADPGPIFHLLLMPFARLPLETAAVLGTLLGQVFLVGSFAAALWIARVPRPWWLVLGLAGIGTLFAQRMEMCRPHVWLIGFSVLVAALLVERRWKWLFAACALFALTHAGAWIAIPLALLWSLSGLALPPEPGGRRVPWRPVAAAAGGWLLGQLVNPDVPENFRLLAVTNFVIPFQATGAGNALLHSQLGTELSPPGLDVLLAQWPAFLVAAAVALTLLARPRLRSRATLTVGLTSLAFLLAGSFAIRRFLELGAPLALLALALVIREQRDRREPALFPGWERMLATLAIAAGSLWTFTALRSSAQGGAAPMGMASWLGEHGATGERVFTAQWGDSAPLFYFAPRLQSLVALDPTAFYLKDPRLFAVYVSVVSGEDPDPARTIRERFGARWLTIPPALYPQLFNRIAHSPGAQALYSDENYWVVDLGKPRG
ncbi:MAG: hypothetical protein ACJ76N_02670 [Thermoanaerobaculia bacterium]